MDESLQKAIAIVKTATEQDTAGNYALAFALYQQALDLFMHALKYGKNEKVNEQVRRKVTSYLQRAEDLGEYLKTNQAQGPVQVPEKKTEVAAVSADDQELEKLQTALNRVIIRENPNVPWDKVAGLDEAKAALKETVIIPAKFPSMFKGERKPWKGILLYGPPGTGKSYLAKAVATEAKSTFYSVSSADLISKWQGESERLVKEMFAMAHKSAPSIIFIDEVDSLGGQRDDSSSDSSRRITNQLLIEMDGLGNGGIGQVLVLCATNIPWKLDAGLMRRCEKRIYIALPDKQSRSKMFKIHLGNTPNTLTPEDFESFASRTEWFSGSDISHVVRDALMQPLRRLQTSTHFKRVTGNDRDDPTSLREYLTPCSPTDDDAEELDWTQLTDDDLLEPPITRSDFDESLKSMRPSVDKAGLSRFEEFAKTY